jgi:predicted Fe-S protein YdhL (DUF1289 family)
MDGGLCIGCFRTIDEIAHWSGAGDDDRRLILAAVVQRRSLLDASTGHACNLGEG